MKHIAILLGLSMAALARQPVTEQPATAPTAQPSPTRLYLIKDPGDTWGALIEDLHQSCPDVVITANKDAAQYSLNPNAWRIDSGWAYHMTGTLYKNGDLLAAFTSKGRYKKFPRIGYALEPRTDVAQPVCKKIEETKAK